MKLGNTHKELGVYYLSSEETMFSETYISIRNKEQRILSDNEVNKLPFVSSTHPYFNEWKLRQKSTRRFINYLSAKSNIINILDIGCGNGWFSNTMATVSKKHHVIGLDVNKKELEQAARVFKKNNLQFLYANICEINGFEEQFDIITLNASIQYFSDLKTLFNTLKSFLKPYGEIHIIDSPFYKEEKIASAKQRTNAYYTQLGFPEMADYYFHHTVDDLNSFKILYKPHKLIICKFLRIKNSPFMWLKLVNK